MRSSVVVASLVPCSTMFNPIAFARMPLALRAETFRKSTSTLSRISRPWASAFEFAHRGPPDCDRTASTTLAIGAVASCTGAADRVVAIQSSELASQWKGHPERVLWEHEMIVLERRLLRRR